MASSVHGLLEYILGNRKLITKLLIDPFVNGLRLVLSLLLLKKQHAKSKHKEHKHCLERRPKLWKNGDFETLITEGRTLQRGLKRKTLGSTIMFDGNVKDALRLLTKNTEDGVLNQSDKITCWNSITIVLESLKNKHPEGKLASRNEILPAKKQPSYHTPSFV